MLTNSLWRRYVFLLLCSLVFFFAAAWTTTDSFEKDAVTDLTIRHQQFEHAANGQLIQLSALLKILGHRLAAIGLGNLEALHKVMDDTLLDNPAFSAYGLSTPDGNMIINSLNADNVQLPNLRDSPESRETFLKTLEKKGMSLGRTYYYRPIQEWIIPLRYAIRDEAGNPLAVISAAISIENEHNPWYSAKAAEGYYISITKNKTADNKYYSQYAYPEIAPPTEDHKQLYYTSPYPDEIIAIAKQRISDAAGTDFSSFLESGKSVHYIVPYVATTDDEYLEVISYDSEFEIFTSLSILYPSIRHSIYLKHTQYFALLLTFNLVLFFVIRYIVNIQEKSRRMLEHQANHDQLTQLPNRYYLELYFAEWLKRIEEGYSVIFLDMDNFKIINDSYGHKMGDNILQVLGKRLQNHNPEDTLVVRQGGDEFIILIPHCDYSIIKKYAISLSNRLRHPVNIDGLNFSLSGSIGIAISEQSTDQLGDLLRKADMAMYEAKKERDHFAFFSHHLQQISDERSKIEDALHHAVANDQLFMIYQPQIEATTGQVFGVEALIRWRHPTMGFISPVKFIPVAESSSQINTIGEFVIDTTLREISEIYSAHLPFQISINVSVRQLHTYSFRKIINDMASVYGIAPPTITLEITESLFIDDLEHIHHVLMQLKHDGFKISLDDFGTGYSSLSMLSQLPIDEVKIDKSFVDKITEDRQGLIFVENIIGICHGVGIPALAEGVENVHQAVALRACDCDMFQGYYFAKPMEKQNLTSYLADFSPYNIPATFRNRSK
ncbi:MAG: EAL domain-containing protein [Candidatus Thiodiazotropha sp.]